MTPPTQKVRAIKPEVAGAPAAARPEPAVETIRLTGDRLLVRLQDDSERRSKAGLLIPATATSSVKRCVWSEVILTGPDVRNVRTGDRVLFLTQTGLEVDVRGDTFLLLRERDVQGIASDRMDHHAGQYL